MKMKLATICGLFAVILPLLSMLFLSTQNEFTLFEDYFSLLGIGPFGTVFNVILMISAFLLVPLLHDVVPKKYSLLIACLVAAIMGIALVPMGPSLHSTFTVIATVLFGVLIAIVGVSSHGVFRQATLGMVSVLAVGMGAYVFLRVQGIAYPPWAEVVMVGIVMLWVSMTSLYRPT